MCTKKLMYMSIATDKKSYMYIKVHYTFINKAKHKLYVQQVPSVVFLELSTNIHFVGLVYNVHQQQKQQFLVEEKMHI